MQKLIRQIEGNDAYDSDEEENPYASSVSPLYLLLPPSTSDETTCRLTKRKKRKSLLRTRRNRRFSSSRNRLIREPVHRRPLPTRHQNLRLTRNLRPQHPRIVGVGIQSLLNGQLARSRPRLIQATLVEATVPLAVVLPAPLEEEAVARLALV
jgi:hypothetical protein